MPIVKIKEVIGISPNSFEDALREAIKQVCEQKKNVTGAKVLSQSVTIKDGEIVEYKVNVNVAYLWEKELHK
ncbi:dodecin domain-containing protein [bacterium]|nr:dodecin domain-containing protein [bacterium]